MLSLDLLAALDLYVWLEREEKVAQKLALHQSTVSRHVRSALKTFDLRLDRSAAHKAFLGDDVALLAGERWVHQLARLRGRAPLRLDAAFSSGPWFAPHLPPGWISGMFDLPGKARPLQLLEERVIDAWIGSYQPDMPDPDDPLFFSVDLLHFPVYLTAAPDHPLACERQISSGDLARFPSLALPSGWFPRTEAKLKAQGLWSDPVRIQRYEPESWEGRSADGVTMLYGTSFSDALQPGNVRLDWDMQHCSGDTLVVRRDLVDAPPIAELIEGLQQRACHLAQRFDDVQLAA